MNLRETEFKFDIRFFYVSWELILSHIHTFAEQNSMFGIES